MSYRHVEMVLNSSIADPTEAAVMIALAHHADQYFSCYPSIARICQLARYKERAVQNAIRRLQDRGALLVKTGGGRGGASVYTIVPSALNPAADAPISVDKPRTKNTVSGAETPHLIPETPHLIPLNPAADAPEPIQEPNQEPTTVREAEPQEVVGVAAAPSRREEVLILMGCDTSGVRPDGKGWTGSLNDQQEWPKWDALALSRTEQDAKIREMLDSKRRSEPGFIPSTWRWFTTGMQSLADDKKAGPVTGTSSARVETPEQRQKRRKRMIGG